MLRCYGDAAGDWPDGVFIGCLIMTLAAGEFRSAWESRLNGLAAAYAYHQQRFAEFANIYRALKASHALLEQNAGGTYLSLRAALAQLQTFLALRPDDAPEAAAHRCLELLARFGHLQAAALYWCSADGGMQAEPAACIGQPGWQEADQGGLRDALTAGGPFYLNPAERHQEDTWLAALPLVDIRGRRWGVVAIQHMPFGLMNPSHLGLMSLLCGRIADFIGGLQQHRERAGAPQVLQSLRRCRAEARVSGVPSSFLVFRLAPGSGQDTRADLLVRAGRAADHTFRLSTGSGPLLLRVLPFTCAAGAMAHIERIKALCREQHIEFPGDGVDLRRWTIVAETDLTQLQKDLTNAYGCFES